jgi:hypothetical protein
MTTNAMTKQWTHESFLSEPEADSLFNQMLLQPWLEKSSDCAEIHYGCSYTLRGGARDAEIPEIPTFLADISSRISHHIGMPVNYIQCHRFGSTLAVNPHPDPAGMIVPMLALGQARTFRVGGTMPKSAYFRNQVQRKVEIHIPEEEILLTHGSLLTFDGGRVLHSMFPADQDPAFAANGFPYRITLLFRYTTPAMREKGTVKNKKSQQEYAEVKERFNHPLLAASEKEGSMTHETKSLDQPLLAASELKIDTLSDLEDRLGEIAKRINAGLEVWKRDAKEAGGILLKLKDSKPHGEWLPYLKTLSKKLKVSERTCERWMAKATGTSATPKLKDGKTVHGYPQDVIRHIFQTAIRQGDEHRALQCAVELDESGSTEWMWGRMPVIASEDIGLARLGLQREIETLQLQWKRKRGDKMFSSHRLFLIHAVLLLVRVQKSRLTDHALIEYYNHQEPIEISETDLATADAATDPIVIIDADLDGHSTAGRKLGRRNNTAEGINFFWGVSAQLNHVAPIDDPYKEKARQTLIRTRTETA